MEQDLAKRLLLNLLRFIIVFCVRFTFIFIRYTNN